MADSVPPPNVAIEWSRFVPVIAEPARTADVAMAVAPDGRSLSLIFSGFTADCMSGLPPSPVGAPVARTESATLTGVLTTTWPKNLDWYATRGDVRGFAGAVNGGQAVLSVVVGAAGRVEALQANPNGEGITREFDFQIFSSGRQRARDPELKI